LVTFDAKSAGHLDKFLYEKLEVNLGLRFDVVLGNPPYQMNNGSGLNGASALYDKFMQLGNKLSQHQVFIVPMRWATHYNAKGIDKQWVINELHSNKYVELKYFSDSENVFHGTRIRGGVMYYVRDNKYNGKCNITHVEKNYKQVRKLASHDDSDMLIIDPLAASIIDKVWTARRFSDCISNTNPFGVETNQQTRPGGLRIYKSFGKVDTIDINDVQRGNEYIDSFGNIVLRTFGYGDNSDTFELLSTPIIKEPGDICTGSYLLVYPTLSKEVAHRVNKFMQTKFVAYLVDLRKSTHNCTRDAYRFIPMQDFEGGSDIDFDLSIQEIDEQLYRKYKLSQIEIDHINSKFSN